MKSRILVTRSIPEVGLERLRAAGLEVVVSPLERGMSPAELRQAAGEVQGLLCMLTDRVDRALLQAAPELRGVANFAVGYDNLDLTALTERGVPASNTPGVLTEATADLAWALLLSAARRVVEGDRLARSGHWDGWKPLELLGGAVAGATLAVIGAGRIGAATARRGLGFGMRILYVDPHPRPELETELGARRVELTEALEAADYVSLHVPLTRETRHLIGRAELGRMKPTAVLINTSRGPVVDEAALIEHLRAGRIRAAGLDVYEREPGIPEALRRLDRAVLLPHLGSATVEARERMACMAADNLRAMMAGRRPPNLLNPEALDR